MISHTLTNFAMVDGLIEDHHDLGRRIEAEITRLACGRIRELNVICSEGQVILRGRSPTYYAKQLAQQAVLDVMTGVSRIVNQIVVS